MSSTSGQLPTNPKELWAFVQEKYGCSGLSLVARARKLKEILSSNGSIETDQLSGIVTIRGVLGSEGLATASDRVIELAEAEHESLSQLYTDINGKAENVDLVVTSAAEAVVVATDELRPNDLIIKRSDGSELCGLHMTTDESGKHFLEVNGTKEAMDEARVVVTDALFGAGMASDLYDVLNAAVTAVEELSSSGPEAVESASTDAQQFLNVQTDIYLSRVSSAVATATDKATYLSSAMKTELESAASGGLEPLMQSISSFYSRTAEDAAESEESGSPYLSSTSIEVKQFGGGLVWEAVTGAFYAVSVILASVSKIAGIIAAVVSTVVSWFGSFFKAKALGFESTRFTIHQGRNICHCFDFCVGQSDGTSSWLASLLREKGWAAATIYDKNLPLVHFVSLAEPTNPRSEVIHCETHLSSDYNLAHIMREPVDSDYSHIASHGNFVYGTDSSGYPQRMIAGVVEFNDEDDNPYKLILPDGRPSNANFEDVTDFIWYYDNVFVQDAPRFKFLKDVLPVLRSDGQGGFNTPTCPQLMAASYHSIDYGLAVRLKSWATGIQPLELCQRLMSAIYLLGYGLFGYNTGKNSTYPLMCFDTTALPLWVKYFIYLWQFSVSMLTCNFHVSYGPTTDIFSWSESQYGAVMDTLIYYIQYVFDGLRYSKEAIGLREALGVKQYGAFWRCDTQQTLDSVQFVTEEVDGDVAASRDWLFNLAVASVYGFTIFMDAATAKFEYKREELVNEDRSTYGWPAGFQLELPTLTYAGYIDGLIADSFVALAAVAIAAVAVYTITKVKNFRAKLQANTEAAWYNYQDAEGSADKAEAWKKYKRTRLGYNIVASLTGGTTLSLGLYDEGEEDESSGFLSAMFAKITGSDEEVPEDEMPTLDTIHKSIVGDSNSD